MIALADRAAREEVVPGGIFWVTVDGGDRDLIESLAGLAEKLRCRRTDKQERAKSELGSRGIETRTRDKGRTVSMVPR